MTSTNTSPETTSISSFMAAIETRGAKPLQPFEQITLPERHLKETNWNNYNIYKSASEFITVEAEAAYEAIAKSGILRPFKVVRAMKEVGDVLTAQNMAETLQVDIKEKQDKVPENGIIDPPNSVL
jgi:hypothetical protein